MSDLPRGQASAEYVSLLLLVALVLAAASSAAAAVPGVGERVVRTLRTGICIVGGDICRSADAAAAGLEPCVVGQRSQWQDTTLEVALVHVGGHGEWQLGLQSDGRATVTRLEENELGATVGVGVTFSPAGVEATAGAALVAGYRGGRAWRFPDVRAARGFLEAAVHDEAVSGGRPPDVRWHAVSTHVGGEAATAVGDLASAGFGAAVDGAVGVRTEGARRTVTIDLGIEAPQVAAELPGFAVAGRGLRSTVADVTWERGTLRELVLRAARTRGDRVEEYAARLDLRAPESRAIAARVLRSGGIDRAAKRALTRHIARVGMVERNVYAVSEKRNGLTVSGKLGVSLGFSHTRTVALRRLVDAVSWTDGGPPRRRFDCLGV